MSRPYVEFGVSVGEDDPLGDRIGRVFEDRVWVDGEMYDVWLRREASEFPRTGRKPGWIAKAPALKGCVACGRTMGEAKAKVKDAIRRRGGC